MASTLGIEKVKDGRFHKVWKSIKDKINGYEALWICALLAVILAAIALYAFLHTHVWGLNMPANQEQWGQYGDFVGGVLGTLVAFVSVYYLVRTLQEQRDANIKVSANNENVAKMHILQQFDNNYQQLLRLYHEAVEDYAHGKEIGKKALGKWVCVSYPEKS